jgi:Alpha/beta hydrolase family
MDAENHDTSARQTPTEPDAQLRTRWVDLDLLRAMLYADCDDTIVHTVFKQIRSRSWYAATLRYPLGQYPSVPCTYVICGEDRLVCREWSERVARDRLDADVVELPGSHSPFLSRPSALADVLIQAAEK